MLVDESFVILVSDERLFVRFVTVEGLHVGLLSAKGSVGKLASDSIFSSDLVSAKRPGGMAAAIGFLSDLLSTKRPPGQLVLA